MCLYFLDDSVYLSDENQREEYVRNDFGVLYQGTPKQISHMPWDFDQVRTAQSVTLRTGRGYV